MTIPEKTLAEQALHLYDNKGEKVMLLFIANHLDSRPPGAVNNPHALLVLQDHSAVQATDFLYNFLWVDYEYEYPGERRINVDRIRSRRRRLWAAFQPMPEPRQA